MCFEDANVIIVPCCGSHVGLSFRRVCRMRADIRDCEYDIIGTSVASLEKFKYGNTSRSRVYKYHILRAVASEDIYCLLVFAVSLSCV